MPFRSEFNYERKNIRKFSLLVAIITMVNLSTAQKLPHSVYIGVATGTNVGGAYGIGTEIFVNKYTSGSFAIGSVHPILKEDVDKSKFDFDIGLKIYPFKYLYFGINYGLIDYEYSDFGYAYGSSEVYYKETRGYSFSVGGRTPSFKNFYLSGFIGITDNEEANHGLRIIENNIITPRLGFMLGYCLLLK